MGTLTPMEAITSADDSLSPLADPADRVAAKILDLLVPALQVVLVVPIGILVGSPNLIRVGFALGFVVALAATVLNVLWLHRHGQTVGKRVLGLRVVRGNGARVTLGRILGLRTAVSWMLGAIPLIGWIYYLADGLFVFANDRRCLHDRIADTIVVDVRRPTLP